MPVALRPAAALLVVALAACDAAPGPAAEAARPRLSDLAITPDTAALGTDAPEAAVPLAVAGTLAGDGPAEVRVLVRWAEADTLVADVAAEVAPGPFRVEVPLTLARGAIGDYAVTVATEGPDGRAGDRAAAVLQFSAENLGPPSVTVADGGSVARPAGTATRTVPIRATVTDPDGRANVAAVVLQIPEDQGGGVIDRIFDEGDGQDETAGDGVYSAGLVVDSAFPVGTFALEVVAIDRAGAASEPAPFIFTIR